MKLCSELSHNLMLVGLIDFIFTGVVEEKDVCSQLVCSVPHSECVMLDSGEEICVCQKGFSGDGMTLCEGTTGVPASDGWHLAFF